MDNHNQLPQSLTSRLFHGENNLFQLAAITIITFVLMSALKFDTFFTMRNMTSMSFLFPELGIFAVGMGIAMLTGGIDLSVVGVANLSSILVGFMFIRFFPAEASPAVAALFIASMIVLAILIGALCGCLNGILISVFQVPPMLATLGTMQLFTGISIVITNGQAVVGYPPQYSAIGNGSIGPVAIPLLIFIVILVLFSIASRRTVFGVNLYLIGTNLKAAVFAGLQVKKQLTAAYMLVGALAGIAGIIISSRTNAAKADYGSSYILQSVLVVVLGGVKPTGGKGTVLGIFLAVLDLQFLSSGFNMLRFSNFAKEFVWGAFLLVIMVINYYTHERRKT
ncbi:MAG: ABC transporter permease [Planctomycetes bacterium]|nr:ABC transporter permease [Planctomycetota bacterium]